MACCLAGTMFLPGQHLLVTCIVAPCSSGSTMVISTETILKLTFQLGTPKCCTNCISYCLDTVPKAILGTKCLS